MFLLTLVLACPAPSEPEPIPETGQDPPPELQGEVATEADDD
jgi:hypothetical protein